jgi:hypothetical protein
MNTEQDNVALRVRELLQGVVSVGWGSGTDLGVWRLFSDGRRAANHAYFCRIAAPMRAKKNANAATTGRNAHSRCQNAARRHEEIKRRQISRLRRVIPQCTGSSRIFPGANLSTSSHEEAEAYDRWFQAKVKTALDDKRPAISHETVMSELRTVIEAKRDNDASGPMES